MSLIQIQEVTTERVAKGRGGYNVANVVYTDGGKNFTKKIMSFSNPAVYETISKAQAGEQYDVTVTKEGEYYNWTKIVKAGAASPTSAGSTPNSGRVTGSNYETADERKLKQLYIIRQSSIANAIEYLSKNPRPDRVFSSVTDVLEIAQDFVDFVYGEKDLVEMDSDLP